jgi:2-phosphosulfolactate phosphatase
VFRAFTTAAVAIANGARRIVMVGAVDEALALRAAGAGRFCIGETGGRMPPGFDYGNSPQQIAGVDFAGATLIQRTSAGTQGIVAAAPRARRLYAAALVTATATARALAADAPDRVTLVAMGENAARRSDEDELCAVHLRHLLQGRRGDPEAVRRLILAGGAADRFHARAAPHMPPEDAAIALDIDRYDFAIRVELEDGRPVARRE